MTKVWVVTYQGVVRTETGPVVAEQEAIVFSSEAKAKENLRRCQQRWPRHAPRFRTATAILEQFGSAAHFGELALGSTE